MYYIYLLRCQDHSIYTGITTDIDRRMKEHFTQNEKKCAKYTLRHKAIKVELVFVTDNRSHASKLEYEIKRLEKNKKENLIKEPCLLEDLLGHKMNCEAYQVYQGKEELKKGE